MKMRGFKTKALKTLGWLALAFVALGLVLPYVSAGRLRGPVQRALENALGRHVTLGAMHWALFTGPGIRVDNVEISEDPSIGAEPSAYVGSLVVTPSISSLWHKRLECSSLRLEHTHVNLARTGSGGGARWNFTMLAEPRLLAAFPTIRVRDGRVNFRVGNEKSVFYLLNTDLDVTPLARDGSDWSLTLQGEPARTDRPARGFGSFKADGRWRRKANAPGQLDLRLTLDNSEIGDMVALLQGHDYGLQGHVSGKVTLNGPPDGLDLHGALRLSDLHGWEQAPPSGDAWRFRVAGRWNSVGQDLEVQASAEGKPSVIEGRFRVSHYLSEAAWGAQARLNHLPLDALVDVGRHLGAPLPAGTQLRGTADGVVGYSQAEGLSGKLAFDQVRLTFPSDAAIEMPAAEAIAGPEGIQLNTTQIRTGNDTAEISASYAAAAQELVVRLRSDGMPLQALQKQAVALGMPLFPQVEQGAWRGELRYVRNAAAFGWTGEMHLSDAQLRVEGMDQPVAVARADAELNQPRVALRNIVGHVAGVEIRGDYQYDPAAPRAHQFHLTLGSADLAAIENAWLPMLHRKTSLIDRALGRTGMPAWLDGWHAEGTLQAARVDVNGLELRRFRTQVEWNEGSIILKELHARFGNGDLAGDCHIDVRAAAPGYGGAFTLSKAEWQGGRVDADAHFTTSGLGVDTLKNLSASGTFEGRGLNLLELPAEIAGAYQFAQLGLHLTDVKLTGRGVSYTGTGDMPPGGPLVLKLSDGERRLTLAARARDGFALKPLP